MSSPAIHNTTDVYRAIADGDDVGRLLGVPPGISDLAVAEISGRDSVAAAVRAIEARLAGGILPVADRLPNLRGDLVDIRRNVDWLQEQCGDRVLDLVVFEHGALYAELTDLSLHYLDTPCVGCHLYFHGYPVPVVRALGGRRIIAGERTSHDGRIKVNQVPLSLDMYTEAVGRLGAELLTPLREVTGTAQVLNALGSSWYFTERNPQLHCDPEFGTKPALSRPDEMDDELRAFFGEAIPLLEERLRPWLP